MSSNALMSLGMGWGTSKHNCLLSYFIILTTTCFSHCGPFFGHKNVYRGNYTEYDHSINAPTIKGLIKLHNIANWLVKMYEPFVVGVLIL